MKKKKDKNKSKSNSPNENDKNEKEIAKEIGIFDDFIVYDKDEKPGTEKSEIKNPETDNLKDIFPNKKETKQTKSRFFNLFKELNKKIGAKVKGKKNDNDKNEEKGNENIEIEEDEEKLDEKEEKKILEHIKTQNYDNENDNDNDNNIISDLSEQNNEDNMQEFDYKSSFFPEPDEKLKENDDNESTNQLSTMNTGSTGITGLLNNLTINSDLSLGSKSTLLDHILIKEPVFEPNVDIKKILSLEDKRTTMMIKNIPNKFSRDLLISTIDQNFKGTYDLFILPTDGNKNKNFGYSFINFTYSYFIPYFYYMFNGKKWSSTNSQKICEITYSKVQGRENLIGHYPNKIIYRNEVVKNEDQKFIIPNEYKSIFSQIHPNQKIEEFNFYFLTKMPNN